MECGTEIFLRKKNNMKDLCACLAIAIFLSTGILKNFPTISALIGLLFFVLLIVGFINWHDDCLDDPDGILD